MDGSVEQNPSWLDWIALMSSQLHTEQATTVTTDAEMGPTVMRALRSALVSIYVPKHDIVVGELCN